MAIDLASVTKEDFDVHHGTTFVMWVSDERAIELQLVETEPLSTRAGAPRRSFRLRFRSAERHAVPQRIYPLDHPVMGRMDVFLVPVGPDAIGMQYDAIFG